MRYRELTLFGPKLMCSLMFFMIVVLIFAQTDVSTPEGLNNVRNNLNGNYIQTADIDLSGYDNWEPIGTSGTPFTGTYDGGGFVIKNLKIDRTDTDNVGLFGYVRGTSGTNGVIENTRLENVNITGKQYVGALVGNISPTNKCSTPKIDCCSVQGGTITGSGNTGGLIGYAKSHNVQSVINITLCYSDVTVSGQSGSYFGGLIGNSLEVKIENCFAIGNVIAGNASYVGGFVGNVDNKSGVENCFSHGEVTSTGNSVGAFAGSGSATNCYYNSEINDGLSGTQVGTGLTEAQFNDPDEFNSYSFVNTWQMSPAGHPELRENPASGTVSDNLEPDGEGVYNNDEEENYLGFKDEDNSIQGDLVIQSGYSTNPTVLGENALIENETLTNYAFFKFFTRNNGVLTLYDLSYLTDEDSFFIQMPIIPDKLLYRYAKGEWKELGSFEPGGFGSPVYTYVISWGDLDLDNNTRTGEDDFKNMIEFAGVNIDEPPYTEKLYISEVCDKPTVNGNEGTGFIELYNNHSETVNVGGLQIRVGSKVEDDFIYNNGYVFNIPNNTKITALGTLVISGGAEYNTFKTTWNLSKDINFVVGHSSLVLTSGFAYQLYIPQTRSGEIDSTPNIPEGNRALQVTVGKWELYDSDNPEGPENGDPGKLTNNDNTSQTLPVELSSFTSAVTKETFVQLNWTAETETNMLGYNIYRSETNKLAEAVKMNLVIIAAHNTSTTKHYSYIDNTVNHRLYYYWLQSNDLDLTNEFHGPVSILVEDEEDSPRIEIPFVTELRGAYPNPFNPATHIRFSLAEKETVSLVIYNMKGQLIRTLIDNQEYGRGKDHTIFWDGKDYQGSSVSSGVYLYILQAGEEHREAQKMLLMK